ncbi:hypothetical protein JCM15519_37020 [Fundidesulfovibrio butyratiphilus]
MAVIQPVYGAAPAERTSNVGANPLDEARATASSQSATGRASALHPDATEQARQPTRTLPIRQTNASCVAGTPAESGGKGAIVSIMV